ncbi:MAG: ABC transporter substrate-binding protein [Pseudomonadota bacterium]
MPDLTLSLAMGDYDRTRPIFDGRVKIDGVTPVAMLQSPEEMFFNAFRHQTCDVSELSLSSYCVSLTRENPPYIAVPVFLSRAFRHSAIYIRSDRGIDGPSALRGRRIGIAEYQLTANVWARRILAEHGVAPTDITWVRGGMDTPGRPEKLSFVPPQGLVIEPAPEGATLNAMLAEGEIDGFIGPRWPRCFGAGHPHVARLFPDSQAAEDWYARTRIFPIMHVLGLRRSLADAHPWLPGALLKAFSAAKSLATAALADTSASKVTMPFVEETLLRAQKMGGALWSYGVAGNEPTLEAFLDAHFEQGLSPQKLTLEHLFHPATYEGYAL